MSVDSLPMMERIRLGGRTDMRCPKTSGVRDPAGRIANLVPVRRQRLAARIGEAAHPVDPGFGAAYLEVVGGLVGQVRAARRCRPGSTPLSSHQSIASRRP